MKPQAMIREIASYGFGIYRANGHVIIADPEDDEEGFGIECDTLEQAYAAWDDQWTFRDSSR